ncbi:hypothetical protein HYU21_00445 [Candidatus Woesearchaeota archaeon]|nr:hypothetical protein [Candidatus Woesearchaeota archaeon]
MTTTRKSSLAILGAAIATLVNCTNNLEHIVNSTNAQPQVSLEETVSEPESSPTLYQLFAPSLSVLLKKYGHEGTIHDATSMDYERKIGDVYLANSKPAYLTIFEKEKVRGLETGRATNNWLVGIVDNEDGTYQLETGAQNQYWNDEEKYKEVKPFITVTGSLDTIKTALPVLFSWQINFENIDRKCQQIWAKYDQPESLRRIEIQSVRDSEFRRLANERNWPGLHLDEQAKKGLLGLAKVFDYEN